MPFGRNRIQFVTVPQHDSKFISERRQEALEYRRLPIRSFNAAEAWRLCPRRPRPIVPIRPTRGTCVHHPPLSSFSLFTQRLHLLELLRRRGATSRVSLGPGDCRGRPCDGVCTRNVNTASTHATAPATTEVDRGHQHRDEPKLGGEHAGGGRRVGHQWRLRR